MALMDDWKWTEEIHAKYPSLTDRQKEILRHNAGIYGSAGDNPAAIKNYYETQAREFHLSNTKK
jgi:hypothetical protein